MLDLLGEAAAWMDARGYANWPARFPTRLVEAAAAEGELCVAEIDERIVATLTLQWSDAYFWGDAGEGDDAGYVHRLAVRRSHAGSGIGYRLLDWSDEQALARGRRSLRLDVVTENRPLRRYYETAGFVHCRDVAGEAERRDGSRWQWRTSLYERPSMTRADRL